MTITAALVVYAVSWFMVFFVVLPWRFVSQQEAGEVVPGTPVSAPAGAEVARKARITTVIATVVFVVLYLIITSGWITVDNMDVFGIMS